MKKLVFLPLVSFLTFNAYSQLKIGNNPTTINSNSILELESTNKGLLLPRVALESTNSAAPLSSFVAGMIVYNTATAGDVLPGFYVASSTSWTKIDNASPATLYSANGSIPASTTRAVTFGSGSNLNFDANTLYIDGNNNRVGIGTATPSNALHVNGTAQFVNGATISNFNSGTWINLPTTGSSGIGTGGAGAQAWIAYVQSSGQWFNDASPGDIAYRNTAGKLLWGNNSTAAAMALNGDKLGIGTLTPSEKLDVAGNIRFSGALMPNNTAGTSGQVLTSAGAGAVPTWTTLPTATTYTGSTSITLNGTSFERAALTGDVTAAANSNALTIANDAVTSAKILDGTIATADVANSAVTYAKIQNVSANNTLLGRATTGAGTVEEITLGTGLSLTGTTLSASSDLRLVNTTSHVTQDAGVGSNGSSAGGADNIMLGSGTGNSNSGTKNVFIGKEAGNANTTSSGSTFIGYQTGKSNTTGGANTYLGYQSGLSGTTSSANTFVGYQSGNSNTGDNNNAFGYLALRQNTSGGGNAAFGTQSMLSNSTGFENTALGTYTLFNNSTGYLNVASGARSMMSNTTGNNNTANGYQSLTANTSGSSNTAFGSQSLSSNLTGSNNVSIGMQSLQLATSSNNLAIGFKAGDNITTGAKNLIIGYDIDAPSATSNNQLNIGNIIFGNNIDGSATTLSTGNIGIGNASPSEKLDVTGNVKFSGALMPNNSAGTAGQVLTSAGAGAVPTWTTISAGTTYTGSTSVTLNGTSFERAALTGDVTATANSNSLTIANDAVTSAKILDGTIATADVANSAVTYGKIQNVSANNRILGRATTGAGTIEEITLGSGLTLTGTTLSASGDLRLVNTTSHITQDAGVGSNGTSAGGARNILIGNGAGNANSGTDNVFVGNLAGNSTSIVGGLTFVGSSAGKSHTTGEQNTFIGFSSGESLTNGSQNTALGYSSLKSSVTGYNNTAIGNNSLTNNTQSYNTAIGSNALSLSSTGVANTAVGTNVMSNSSVGNHNTSIGFYAALNTTGDNNVVIGSNSGSNLTTGSRNILIGRNINAPIATGSNQLSIGNLIFGNNVDGDGSNTSSGNIGIGVVDPSEKLDVDGAIKFSGALMPNNSAGTAGQVLTSAGPGSVPTWTTISAGTTYTGSTSITLNGTSFERAALTGDVTATANSNALTIANDAVTSTKILDGTIATNDLANASITAAKLNQMSATTGQVMKWNGTAWAAANDDNTIADGSETVVTAGSGISISGAGTSDSPYVINANAAIATVTADYTATSSNNTILCNVPGAGMTLTLPSASTNTGKVIVIRKIDNDADVLTFSPALNYSTTQTISTLNFVKTITVQSNGTSWWVITE